LRFGMWLFLFWNVSFRTVSSLWGECWKSKLEGRICKSCPFVYLPTATTSPKVGCCTRSVLLIMKKYHILFFYTLGYHERREIHTVMILDTTKDRNRSAWYTVSKICIWKGIGIIIILLLLLIHHTDRQHDHPATVVDYWSSHCFHLIIIPRHRTGNWNRSSCRRRWRTVLEKERRWRERKITNCW